MKVSDIMRLCMENQTGHSKPNVETEVAIYAKMTHSVGLEEADHVEHHEQLEGPSVDGGRFRCRKTTIDNDVKYTLTMKVKSKEEGIAGVRGDHEYDLDIDEGFYEAFKALSTKRLDKTRYVFHGDGTSLKDGDPNNVVLPSVKYEVDVFKRADGEDSQWVKIDIELDSIIERLTEMGKSLDDMTLSLKVSHLPFKPVGGFIAKQATPEQKQVLDAIWDTEFNLPVYA